MAGFFEGEGTITIWRFFRKGLSYYVLKVSVVNTDLSSLTPFKEFGGTITADRLNLRNPRWKNAYHWTAFGSEAVSFLEVVSPHFVSERNKKRTKIALEFQSRIKPGRFRKGTGPAEREIRETAFQEMRVLNHRGAV